MRRNIKKWSYNSKLKKEAVVIKSYENLGTQLQVDHSTNAK